LSLEQLSAIGTIGTFVVIAASAIAALIQLRHLRTSNQLTGLLNILGRSEDPQFSEWRQETRRIAREQIGDAGFRRGIETNTYDRREAPWLHLYNWYDYVGSLVKQGLVPEEAVMDVFSFLLVNDWKDGEDLIALNRRVGGQGIWENFEYLVVCSKRWLDRNRGGRYPSNFPRIALQDRWLSTDHPERDGSVTPAAPKNRVLI
jgi:hypothetical protein